MMTRSWLLNHGHDTLANIHFRTLTRCVAAGHYTQRFWASVRGTLRVVLGGVRRAPRMTVAATTTFAVAAHRRRSRGGSP